MQKHFSERLGRYFVEDDWLTRDEAAAVISANSGRYVVPRHLNDMARRGQLHPQKMQNLNMYQYQEVCDLVVKPRPGRRSVADPSPNALRQRKYKERHGLKKVS